MLKHKKLSVILFIMLIGVNHYAVAQACLDAEQYPDQWPDNRYTIHGNGTVTDKATNLMWKACPEGFTDTNNTCATGSAVSYTWSNANTQKDAQNTAVFAGHADWRLPNIDELKTLSASNCHAPAINETVFPNTGIVRYWSAATYDRDVTKAWVVHFALGNNEGVLQTEPHLVRLVRTP